MYNTENTPSMTSVYPRSNGVGMMTSLAIITAILLYNISVASGNDPKFTCPENTPYFYPCLCKGGGQEGIFITCENTNLASIALGLANIRLPIEELRLYKCNMKRLYGDVFKGILLRRLVIEDTPLEEVEEGVFNGVQNTLKGLHFLRAPLTAIPKPALQPLKQLEVIYILLFLSHFFHYILFR